MLYQTPSYILSKNKREFLNKNIYNVAENLKIYILKGVKEDVTL